MREVTGLERGGAGGAAGEDCSPAAVPGFRLQPRQCRRLAAAVSGERRADVQPVLPLHRLPRNRRGAHRKEDRTQDPDRPPCHHPTVRIRTIFSPRCPTAEFERLAPHLELVPMPLGEIALRTRRPVAARLFPHHRHRVAALRHGVRRVGRNRGRGQRRRRRHFAVHGRRYHAQLGRGADRGPRLPAAGAAC